MENRLFCGMPLLIQLVVTFKTYTNESNLENILLLKLISELWAHT